MSVAKLGTELSDAVKFGRAHHRTKMFEDIAVYELAANGFSGEIRVLLDSAERVTTIHLAPRLWRRFADAEHLNRLVTTDLKNGEDRMYIPMSLNHPLVDAWCICTIDEKRIVVGLQVTVAKLKHPIAGEDVAKKHFNAIQGAFATHGVPVHTAAWVVFVLPAAHYAKFPYQYAKVGRGEPRRKAGSIWPHTQAKLAMMLDEHGKPPALAGFNDMRARATTVELSADVTASALCTLHNMGQTRAAQLLSVLHDNTRAESKTVENFLDSLENSHKALAGVLKHESNRGRWAYGGQVWSGSARAPAPTGRPKRRAVRVDGAGSTKRARQWK